MPGGPFDVIVCGSLHLDIMVYDASLPRIDETVVGAKWGLKCGGKGGNQAVMAARAGARTAMIGRVGPDDFGRRLLANLSEALVDASAVIVDESDNSGMSVAIVRNDGEYGAVIVSGANLAIDPASIASQWRELMGSRILILQNEIPEAVNIAAARAARDSGARVVLNAAPARALSANLLDLIDIVVVNRVEAGMLSERPVRNADTAMGALPHLGSNARDVIITLGENGIVVQALGAAPQAIAALPVTVVSTHGAGDCFVGTLAAQLSKGSALVDACHCANEAAAAFVSHSTST